MTAPGAPPPAGFFSYVRADDEHDSGRLTDIRRSLSSEVSAQTGEDFLIFQDKDDILWGQRWQQRIIASLDGTTLLIAAITPRFFKSEACRDELERFLKREQDLGRQDLILPIYYISVSNWGPDHPDELVRELAGRQYYDWRSLRFEPLGTPEIRQRLADMSAQIVRAIESVDTYDPDHTVVLEEDDPDQAPGFVELLAEAEDAMPLFAQTLVDFAAEMGSLGGVAQDMNSRMTAANNSSRPGAAKLTAMRDLAKAFEPSAERMEELAADYTDQLARVDGGISALIERTRETTDQADLDAAHEFAKTLDGLRIESRSALAALEDFRVQLRDVSRISSTIRPVVHRMDVAVGELPPSQTVFDRWTSGLYEALAAHTIEVDGAESTASALGSGELNDVAP